MTPQHLDNKHATNDKKNSFNLPVDFHLTSLYTLQNFVMIFVIFVPFSEIDNTSLIGPYILHIQHLAIYHLVTPVTRARKKFID